MFSSCIRFATLLCFALLYSGCVAPAPQEPESNGSVSNIIGVWGSDTFMGKRHALLVKSDGKAEYTYSEGKLRASDEEVDVDEPVFDDERGGTVVWSIDLVYQGKNTWAAANPVQIQGPQPVPYPRDPESEVTFDHAWRLAGGQLLDVRSKNRYIRLQ